jgi:hypothetical protein
VSIYNNQYHVETRDSNHEKLSDIFRFNYNIHEKMSDIRFSGNGQQPVARCLSGHGPFCASDSQVIRWLARDEEQAAFFLALPG